MKPKTPRSAQQQRYDDFEVLWMFLFRVVSGIIGLLLIVAMAIQYMGFHQKPFVWLLFTAVALCGPVVSQSLAGMIAAARGGPATAGDDT